MLFAHRKVNKAERVKRLGSVSLHKFELCQDYLVSYVELVFCTCCGFVVSVSVSQGLVKIIEVVDSHEFRNSTYIQNITTGWIERLFFYHVQIATLAQWRLFCQIEPCSPLKPGTGKVHFRTDTCLFDLLEQVVSKPTNERLFIVINYIGKVILDELMLKVC